MTYEEFNALLRKLYSDYETKRKEVIHNYCLSLAEFNIGDVIESEFSRIKIQKIVPTYHHQVPGIYYEGIKLRKDYTPFKSGETETIMPHLKITKVEL